MSRKKTKVRPEHKTHCHVNNWTEYDRPFLQSEDLTLWLSPDAIKK